jgi:hypothetical protein
MKTKKKNFCSASATYITERFIREKKKKMKKDNMKIIKASQKKKKKNTTLMWPSPSSSSHFKKRKRKIIVGITTNIKYLSKHNRKHISYNRDYIHVDAHRLHPVFLLKLKGEYHEPENLNII